VEEKVAAQELEEPENTETMLVAELPVDYQIYRLIDDRGPEGLTQTVRFRPHAPGPFIFPFALTNTARNRRCSGCRDWVASTAATDAATSPSTTAWQPFRKT
jgi:hypothetical protein